MSIYQSKVNLNMDSYCITVNDSDEGEVLLINNMGSNCSTKNDSDSEDEVPTVWALQKYLMKRRHCIGYAYGGKVTLNLQKGDITSLQKTEAIVNFVYEDNINGTMGILDKAGDEIKQQYETRRFQDQRCDVTMTAAGNLPYKAIFHVEVFQNSA